MNITVTNFNTSLNNLYNYTKTQERELNSITNQQDLIDIYRTSHLTIAEYSFFFKFPWNIYDRPHAEL